MDNLIKDTDPLENFTDKKQAKKKKNYYNWNCINSHNYFCIISHIFLFSYHLLKKNLV